MDAEIEKALKLGGFVPDERLKRAQQDSAAKDGMSADGDYTVEAVWTRGIVTLSFEQNTSPEPVGEGLTALVKHPPVCVATSSKGRVAVNPTDTELLLHVADDLS